MRTFRPRRLLSGLVPRREAIERLREVETRRRRSYYDYLLARGPVDDSFEQHLDRYGLLARTSAPATPRQLASLKAHAGMSLPAQLDEFCREHGGMRLGSRAGQAFSLPEAVQLLRRLELDIGWERLESPGLIATQDLAIGPARRKGRLRAHGIFVELDVQSRRGNPEHALL